MIKCLGIKNNCGWHKDGKQREAFNCCPILYHSLYPYFLALFYGAKGEFNVCCPAEKGVRCVVKKVKKDGNWNDCNLPKKWKTVIFADIVNIGKCEDILEYQVVIFPGSAQNKYICPAGINNIFPFLKLDIPKCINLKRLRCPDWKENVYYSVEEK